MKRDLRAININEDELGEVKQTMLNQTGDCRIAKISFGGYGGFISF